MESFLSPNSPKKIICLICDYVCSKNSDLIKHESTRKHARKLAGDEKIAAKEFTCEICQKIYKSRNGLWKHNKQCNLILNDENTQTINVVVKDNSEYLTNLVIEVVKTNKELQQQNQEFQKQMLEMYKSSTSNVNHSHNNNHNKTFNMQFFLNEQCKDAMNIMDFVNTFKLEFSDLERVGEVGYVEGISNIIIKKLNEIDIYKRPIHCSDMKRETMFVRDKNVWEKENGNHDKIRLAIKHITKKNTDMLNKWCDAHPGSKESDNYLNDVYMEMVMQAMGGRGDRKENENKIMRKIAKTCLIDKDM
jgi:hypothetical protein